MQINGDSNYHYDYAIANKSSVIVCLSLGPFSNELTYFIQFQIINAYQSYLISGNARVE